MASAPGRPDGGGLRYHDWFLAFCHSQALPTYDQAYRQDFAAIATLLAGDSVRVVHLTPDAITKDAMQTAFAAYADTHEAASIRRC
jgi:integrase/recombinase XerC